MDKPAIRAFFDEPTNTVSYLVWDPATKDGADGPPGDRRVGDRPATRVAPCSGRG